MKLLLFTFLFLFSHSFNLLGQSFESLELGSSGGFLTTTFANDHAEHVVVAGAFGEELSFTSLESSEVQKAKSRKNAYVTKIDSMGNVLWIRTFIESTLSEILAVKTDSKNNIYCAGRFYQGLTFDANPGEEKELMEAVGGGGSFVIKLDPEGDFIWARQFNVILSEMDLDSKDNIFIVGYYYNKTDLDPGPDSLILHTPKETDGFVVKLNVTGDFQWGKSVGGEMLDEITQVDISADDQVIVTGFDRETLRKEPGIKTFFVNKLQNENGKSDWFKTIKSTKSVKVLDVCVSLDSSILLTGEFEGKIQFAGSSEKGKFISRDKIDAFLYKIKLDGELDWTKQLGDNFSQIGRAIFADENGLIYWSGTLGNRLYLNEKELFKDYSFFFVFEPNGKMRLNYGSGNWGTDVGYRFFEGQNKYVYYVERLGFNRWRLKRFW